MIFFDVIDSIRKRVYRWNNWICVFTNHINLYLISYISISIFDKTDQIHNQPCRSNFEANSSINLFVQQFFDWIISTIFTQKFDILWNCDFDAYFFFRYIYILFKIFVFLALLISSVFTSLNFLRDKVNQNKMRNFDQFSWTNFNTKHIEVYWAHLTMIIVIIFYVCFVTYKQFLKFIRIRQNFLFTTHCDLSFFANIILVTNIPKNIFQSKNFIVFSAIFLIKYVEFELIEIIKIWLNKRKSKKNW